VGYYLNGKQAWFVGSHTTYNSWISEATGVSGNRGVGWSPMRERFDLISPDFLVRVY
jgi:hypothetical protein